MIVTVITACYNEAPFVPFFLSHWVNVADKIVCFDGMSTDGTREQLAKWPQVQIVDRDRGGLMDELVNMEIRSTAYKTMASDWFIVVDFDELVFHPSGVRTVLEQYDRLGMTVAWRCEGWDMIANDYPDPMRPITKLVKHGVRNTMYDKTVAFTPLVSVEYGPGGHTCQVTGNVMTFEDAPRMKLLHYKWLGEEYLLKKAKNYELAPYMHKEKWGYTGNVESRFTWVDTWRAGLANRVPVIE